MKICVLGAGYVGLVTATCLADMGNSVMCVDVDEERVATLLRGEVPIHEPSLAGMLRHCMEAGRLQFSTDPGPAVAHGTVIFIAVGTPSAEDGSADLAHVLAAAAEIGRHMQDYKVIAVKSTVPVGTSEQVRDAITAEHQRRGLSMRFSVVSNPEFLKEGAAVQDFIKPDRVILGCDDEEAAHLMREVYAPFIRNRDRLLMMDVRSSELTKYAANAMLATRISFMNEMAGLAERLGADIEHVRRGIGSDPRIGTHFLYAGCGWGGSCLPKDVKALARMGQEVDLELGILQAVQRVNDRQRRLLCDRVVARFGENLRGHRFAVWGLAFKPGTDDLREAPSLTLIDELLLRGAQVRAFDPEVNPGSSQLVQSRPGLELAADPIGAARDASALLIVTEWHEFRSPDFDALREAMRFPVVLDGRNLYEPDSMARQGFEYLGIGRGEHPGGVTAQDRGLATSRPSWAGVRRG